MNDKRLPKHARVYAALASELAQGRWQPGQRLPSEAALMRQFDVSRITVSRAMRDLKRADLVERRPGSGTYVKSRPPAATRSFGVLLPDLGTAEIFEPIFRGMRASPLARRHALLRGPRAGSSDGPAGDDAWQLCRQYIERRASGVFFAPLEHAPDKDEVNRRIADALDKAGIPIVLLDRPLLPFPAPLRHDLVGIDNWRAGLVVTAHLLARGCRRVHFVGLSGVASTVDERESGFREALHSRRLPAGPERVHRAPETELDAVTEQLIAAQADGVVCANDRLAGALLHALRRRGCRVPRDMRMVGIDDVEYASLLPVPLTTLRQPTRAIGETALAMMLERIARPALPVRDVRLQCELVVRETCAAAQA
jgi:DNA-binding LacI/PurR family transcriptional regulator